jgi:predicted nucleic acid-binding Zn ribbon protein
MIDSERICVECGRFLKGRPDKKFCSDACRNSYNNRQNSSYVNLMRNINNILRRNRRLLEEIMPSGKDTHKYHRQRLTEAGYDFRYHTHQYVNTKGQAYHFCYDYGYLQLEGEWLLVVRSKEGLIPSASKS